MAEPTPGPMQDEPKAEAISTFDAGDAKSVKDLQRSAKTTAMRRKEAVLKFMSDKEGRAWFYDLLVKCHIYRNPFSTDPIQMAFSCGEMNIGQQVLVELESADPSLYLQMIKEGHEANG